MLLKLVYDILKLKTALCDVYALDTNAEYSAFIRRKASQQEVTTFFLADTRDQCNSARWETGAHALMGL